MKRIDIDTTIRLQANTVHRALRDHAKKGFKPIFNEEGATHIESQAHQVGDIVKSYYAELARIDREFQPEYRVEKRKEIAVASMAKLREWEKTNLDPYRSRIEGTKARALAARARQAPTVTDSERLILELRQREVRDQVRDLRPLEVEVIYLISDDATRQALENGPPRIRVVDGVGKIEPLVSSEFVAKARNAQAQAEDPEVAAELECLDGPQTFLQVVMNTALDAIREADRWQRLNGPPALVLEQS